jgi:hypothetical protein
VVTDWPDLEERGLWNSGRETPGFIPWLAGLKLNFEHLPHPVSFKPGTDCAGGLPNLKSQFVTSSFGSRSHRTILSLTNDRNSFFHPSYSIDTLIRRGCSCPQRCGWENSGAKFWLEPVDLAKSVGYKSNELAELRRIIEDRRLFLKARWDAHFGS